MTKQIPKFHETFIPILKSLESQSELQREELKRKVISSAYSDLPQELLNQKISSKILQVFYT